MVLEKVNSPRDLKYLSTDELKLLAEEIRALIITVVSQRGGHLASSLGAVELSIALHYCLNSPQDAIIFDVGHQTYAHKILTGRRDSFCTLRELNGISGFPNPKESAHDLYLSGHASTAISWAQGLAETKKLKLDASKTVAVIGDGSLTGGMCFEALNSCGHSQSEVLVILNHNEMSISLSVGALSSYLNKIISAPIYNRIKAELTNFLSHHSLTKNLLPRAKRFEESLKGLLVPGIFFEELGFRYFGPIDGHDIGLLINTLTNILSLKGPRVLHVITKKGKGYKSAEENPEDFHSASTFDVQKGTVIKSSSPSFSDVFGKKLVSLAKRDEKIVAITAAMPKGTGLDIFQKEFPKRFYDVGIAEAHAVGFASGLAKGGFKPVVAIYSTFLQRSFDQLIHDVALQKLPVVFAVDRAGLVGEDGPTHHGVFDVGYLRLIPNMVCMAPKDKEEFEDMLEFALQLDTPASIRYPRAEAYSLNNRQPLELGKSQILIEEGEICLIALGTMTKIALECAELLKQDNINVTVINARFIKPLDEELLRYVANKMRLIVTLEDSNLDCGFGSAVMEFYEQTGQLERVRLVRTGLPAEFLSGGGREKLLKIYGLDALSLATRIKKTLSQVEILPTKSSLI